jgi:hypothetical protein
MALLTLGSQPHGFAGLWAGIRRHRSPLPEEAQELHPLTQPALQHLGATHHVPYELMRGRLRIWLIPALAFGGGGLFLHFHGGGLHLDAIYLQHVAMGLVGLGVGTGLVLSRRADPGSRLQPVWPTFLLLMALILLVNSER